MPKIISCSFLTLMLASMTFAMEPSKELETEKSISKTYATHPAATPGETEWLSSLVPSDLLIRFSSFLKVNDTCSYLLTCQKINEQRELILLAQIPNMYAARNQNFKEVFFQFPHPQWKPEQLPNALALKLHRCYFEALKLHIPTVEPLQLENSETIKRKFQLMYSAACGGHKLAAEEAGAMLLNPLYNDIIPIVIQYTNLVPEAQQWDVRRLNQPQTTNSQLLQFMAKMESALSNDDSDYFTEEDKKILTSMMQELKEIAPTDETKTVNIFLTEVLEHMRNGLHKDLFRPIKTTNFIKGLGYITPFLEHFLNMEDSEETQSTVSVETANGIPTFDGVLNADFIEDFSSTLELLFCNKIPFFNPERPNEKSTRTENKYTLEAREALKEYIATQRIIILLGGKNYYITSMCNAFNPQNHDEFQAAWDQYRPLENKIHAFLYYLTLTRNPVAIQFKGIKSSLDGILNNYGHEGAQNSLRFTLLCKEFSDVAK